MPVLAQLGSHGADVDLPQEVLDQGRYSRPKLANAALIVSLCQQGLSAARARSLAHEAAQLATQTPSLASEVVRAIQSRAAVSAALQEFASEVVKLFHDEAWRGRGQAVALLNDALRQRQSGLAERIASSQFTTLEA